MLRAKREADDLTQAQLAAQFGVRQQTIGAWERGERPQGRFVPVLAEYLGIESDAELRRILDQASSQRERRTTDTLGTEKPDPIELLTESFAERMKRGSMSVEEVAMFRDLFDYHRGVES
jgi:transcriptional regulator with XRE-family HTH domain